MKTLILNNHRLEVYDSIDELPIVNFQKYNKFMLIDSGVGSDIDDINASILKIVKLMNAGDNHTAVLELQNMRQCMFMINSEISPRYLAFSALIHSINGDVVRDLSDDNLKSILLKIKTIKHSTIIDFIAKFKKKVAIELDTYFPQTFDNVKEKEAYDKLKHRTKLVLDSIIDDKDNANEIETIDVQLLSLHKPKSYSGSNSVEVMHAKQFESSCILISQKLNMDAKRMTTLEFYTAMDSIKKQIEAESKIKGKNK